MIWAIALYIALVLWGAACTAWILRSQKWKVKR
jgi:hypothetical protein